MLTPKRHRHTRRLVNCQLLGLIWMALGLATWAYGVDTFSIFLFQKERYPQIAYILSYLVATLAIFQGYWLAKERGILPIAGLFFYLLLTINVSFTATAALSIEAEQTDWKGLFLILLMTLSLLSCGRVAPPPKPKDPYLDL